MNTINSPRACPADALRCTSGTARGFLDRVERSCAVSRFSGNDFVSLGRRHGSPY